MQRVLPFYLFPGPGSLDERELPWSSEKASPPARIVNGGPCPVKAHRPKLTSLGRDPGRDGKKLWPATEECDAVASPSSQSSPDACTSYGTWKKKATVGITLGRQKWNRVP